MPGGDRGRGCGGQDVQDVASRTMCAGRGEQDMVSRKRNKERG